MDKNNSTHGHVRGKLKSTSMTKSRQRKNVLKLLKENNWKLEFHRQLNHPSRVGQNKGIFQQVKHKRVGHLQTLPERAS